MKSTFLTLFVLGIIFSCTRSKVEQSDQDEKEILFLKEVLVDTTILKHQFTFSDIDVNPPSMLNIPGDTTFTRGIDYIAYLLDEKDTLFLRSQFVQEKGFTLKSLASDIFKIIPVSDFRRSKISTDSLWNYIRRNRLDGYYSLSMPIFSKDNKKAYLKISYQCEGHCGNGIEILFIKVNNQWRVKERFGGWVN
jgi:hypothetical protein